MLAYLAALDPGVSLSGRLLGSPFCMTADLERYLVLAEGVIAGVTRPLDDNGVIRPLDSDTDGMREVERDGVLRPENDGVTRPFLEDATEGGRGILSW